MKKVYLLTTGMYSDYNVHAVFATAELAREYADRTTANNQPFGPPYDGVWRIETFEVWDTVPALKLDNLDRTIVRWEVS